MSEMKERPGRTRAPEALLLCPKSSTSKGAHVEPSESKKELREMERNEKKRQSYRKNFKKNQGKINFFEKKNGVKYANSTFSRSFNNKLNSLFPTSQLICSSTYDDLFRR